ncbi:hypothetical protein FY036_20885 [Mesorhizobium microcysteis]|jgi:hypothetical protein|uniref:Uncharacterized protein n=1 Tax=Neoaquamicrobium microcysteis TaxID=2682781 RepID=A0A5D4GUY5_9HYPH|nr:hypothetical protein [Mesorhizobium microcysteis]TYR30330.1 hypothetical protein FY036_20885 [Mesorhizobium microcysteis]
MQLRDDWEMPRAERGWSAGNAGMGALRIALLFGSAAVALALILTPLVENHTRKVAYQGYPAGLDMMATGTIGQRNAPGTYTVRRSVLQPSPNSVCIIRNNGMRSGDC